MSEKQTTFFTVNCAGIIESANQCTVEEVRDKDEVPKPVRTASGAEKEADFQGSLRN
jgi:hypothetical protein